VTYAVKLKKGSYSVEIAAFKVEENLVNQNLLKVANPITQNKQNTTAPFTRAVDLKRIIHTILIHGYVCPQVITAIHESTVQNATVAKNTLITKILYPKGIIELTWRNADESDYDSSSGINTYVQTLLESVKFTDDSGRRDNIDSSPAIAGQYGAPARYLVELNLFRGRLLT
jgi:hypothetical protein